MIAVVRASDPDPHGTSASSVSVARLHFEIESLLLMLRIPRPPEFPLRFQVCWVGSKRRALSPCHQALSTVTEGQDCEQQTSSLRDDNLKRCCEAMKPSPLRGESHWIDCREERSTLAFSNISILCSLLLVICLWILYFWLLDVISNRFLTSHPSSQTPRGRRWALWWTESRVYSKGFIFSSSIRCQGRKGTKSQSCQFTLKVLILMIPNSTQSSAHSGPLWTFPVEFRTTSTHLRAKVSTSATLPSTCCSWYKGTLDRHIYFNFTVQLNAASELLSYRTITMRILLSKR